MNEEKKSLLQRFIQWREKKIKDKHFTLILSFVVGILTALSACFLKFLIEYIKHNGRAEERICSPCQQQRAV